MSRFAAKEQVDPASTLPRMDEDRILHALDGMRTEVAAVTGGIAGLTDMFGTMQIDIISLKEDMVVMKAAVGGLESTVGGLESTVSTVQEDVREIRRDVADLRQTMTRHLDWHLGEAS
jgi:hypothetical protein